MTFVTKTLMRFGLSSGPVFVSESRRKFSQKLCVGPAPGDIINAGDPGSKYYMRNLEKFRKDGRISYLTPEQIARLPQEDVEGVKRLLNDLLRKNEDLFGEAKILNSKVEQLLNEPIRKVE